VVRAYLTWLTWLQDAPAGGDPLNDATARDWAVRDYRSYLVTVAKRATATVNKHLAVYATEEVALVPEPFDVRLGFDPTAAS
jgi:hypothetical protein